MLAAPISSSTLISTLSSNVGDLNADDGPPPVAAILALANLAELGESDDVDRVDVGDRPGPLARLPTDGHATYQARPCLATSVGCPTDYARSNLVMRRHGLTPSFQKKETRTFLLGLDDDRRLLDVNDILRDHSFATISESCPTFSYGAAQANH